ncbi:late competence development ComFB family protein [Cohnella suwonensis]|uniref:Late competence development ComFB family protein n=1 Tax=Cohnella suwonensis TaxID=696072 RepID=A0ABW0M2N1_9BACL
MIPSRELPVLNVMEPIVSHMFEDHFEKAGILKCGCEKCRVDVLSLTLNRVPPRYTSTQAGEAFVKALYQDSQLQSDILRELAKAVQVIEEHPNHS